MFQHFDASLCAWLSNSLETLNQSFTCKVTPINSLLMGLGCSLHFPVILIHITTLSCHTQRKDWISNDEIGKWIWKFDIKHVEFSWVSGKLYTSNSDTCIVRLFLIAAWVPSRQTMKHEITWGSVWFTMANKIIQCPTFLPITIFFYKR